MLVNSESETLAYVPCRQPDTDKFRFWEVAGSSHGPQGMTELNDRKTKRDGVYMNLFERLSPSIPSMVMWSPEADAGFVNVKRWIEAGIPPPKQPPIAVSVNPPAIERDAHGIAKGDVRLPDVEAPIGALAVTTRRRALGALVGNTKPFSPERLKRLHPSHEAYLAKVTTAAKAALEGGVILPDAESDYIQKAKAFAIPA